MEWDLRSILVPNLLVFHMATGIIGGNQGIVRHGFEVQGKRIAFKVLLNQ